MRGREGMGGPYYAHVRGGEGMGGVAGPVHVIPPSYDHSSQESGARDKGIIVLPYRIHFP